MPLSPPSATTVAPLFSFHLLPASSTVSLECFKANCRDCIILFANGQCASLTDKDIGLVH